MLEMKEKLKEYEMRADPDSDITSGVGSQSFSAQPRIGVCFPAFKARVYVGEWQRTDSLLEMWTLDEQPSQWKRIGKTLSTGSGKQEKLSVRDLVESRWKIHKKWKPQSDAGGNLHYQDCMEIPSWEITRITEIARALAATEMKGTVLSQHSIQDFKREEEKKNPVEDVVIFKNYKPHKRYISMR